MAAEWLTVSCSSGETALICVAIRLEDWAFSCPPFPLQKWGDTSCPVCRYCSQPGGGSHASHCTVCNSAADLWICLICGHVGCGRYKAGHAYDHFKSSQHCYALELETHRVRGQGEVHVISSSAADQLPMRMIREGSRESNKKGILLSFHTYRYGIMLGTITCIGSSSQKLMASWSRCRRRPLLGAVVQAGGPHTANPQAWRPRTICRSARWTRTSRRP